MKTQKRLIISFIVLTLSAILLLANSSVRAAVDHNLWTLSAAKAAFSGRQTPAPSPNPHPHAYQWLARLALLQGDPDAALAWLSSQGEANDPLVLNTLAQAYYLSGEPHIALDLWREIGFFGSLIDVAEQAMGYSDLDLAAKAYKAAYEIDPERFTSVYVRLLQRQGEYATAEALLISSIYDYPSSNRRLGWWNILGDVYRNQGDFAGALAAFERVIEIDPSYGLAYYQIGNLLYREGQFAESVAWLKVAVDLLPEHWHSNIYYARSLQANGQIEPAISVYQNMFGLFPNDARIYYEISDSYYQVGQIAEAIDAVEKALVLADSPTLSYYLRAAQVFEAAGELDKALQAYQAVLEITPDNGEALRGVERLTGGE